MPTLEINGIKVGTIISGWTSIEEIGKYEKEAIKLVERTIERQLERSGFCWKVWFIPHDEPQPVYRIDDAKGDGTYARRNAHKHHVFETVVLLVEEHERERKLPTSEFARWFHSVPEDEKGVFSGIGTHKYLKVIYGRSYASVREERVDRRIGRVIAKYRAYRELKRAWKKMRWGTV